MTGGFRISRLTLKGQDAPDAEVRFEGGLNVIVGASNTGKTYIAQCIDFMFGGGRLPKDIPEARPYDTIQLELCLDGRASVLERSLRGGDFRFLADDAEPCVLSAKHQPDREDTVSSLLLRASGLLGKKVRMNQQGKTRDLSFRDIARLILVDETSVIAERSPVFSGQVQKRTVERSVFRLLLTGVDDSSVVAKEDPKIAKGRREGRSEAIAQLLERARTQLSECEVDGDVAELRARLERVEESLQAASGVLSEEQRSATELEEGRKSAWERLREVDSRLAVLAELQKRFTLLKQQYGSDLRRLEAVSEASVRLGQMREERCPVCGALAEHHETEHQDEHASLEEVASASTAEAVKIRSLLVDLENTMASNESDIEHLQAEREEKRQLLESAGQTLSESLRPRVQVALQKVRECHSERDKLLRSLGLLEQVKELEGILEDAGGTVKRPRADGPSVSVSVGEAEQFCLDVEAMLRSWHFPNLERVTFSEEEQDVVISGQARTSHGKGVRAITHAAFNLALERYCRARSKPHPSLVLVDSPLIVYRQPDAGEETFAPDVKDAFYRVLADEYSSSQVIILENDRPPEDIFDAINVTEFTGTQHGRWGFIPRS